MGQSSFDQKATVPPLWSLKPGVFDVVFFKKSGFVAFIVD